MRNVPLVVGLLIILGLAAQPAVADTVTFTVSGTVGGQPVSATAEVTTSANTVTIVLTNLEADPTSVIQNLNGVTFTLGGISSPSPSLSSSSGQQLTVASDGTFTLGSTGSTGWAVSASGANITLTVLGTLIGPANTLIGPPGLGGTYDAAGGSIAGNSAHNPFLNQTATFTITIPGVTADTQVTSLTFLFGTSTDSAPGTPVPEPASALLVGTGLVMLGSALKRRFRH